MQQEQYEENIIIITSLFDEGFVINHAATRRNIHSISIVTLQTHLLTNSSTST